MSNTFKKVSTIILALVATMAVCFALTGCGGQNAEVEKTKKQVVGTWKVTAIDDGTGDMDGYIELLDSMGISMIFTFNEDGTGSLSTGDGDDSTPATWEVKDKETIKLSLDGSSADATLGDDTLNVTQSDGGTMTLTKQKQQD